MSASDSDYSIDWLASDEDDYDSLMRLGPQDAEERRPSSLSVSSSSSSSSSMTTSSKESPSSCFQSGATQRRRSHCCESPAAPQTPAVCPVQGFTSVCSQHHSTRKRAHGTGLDGLCEKPLPDTENELFWHKCMELQRYIHPLSSILRGLRSGRYSERLSSFQESVAMDRIQRILGVLQNPHMGGRFLSIILKIEEMLQSWFPHIKPDMLHTDDITPPKKQKHCSSASPLASSPSSPWSLDMEPLASFSSTHLKWLHTSPICSLKTPESRLVVHHSSSSSSSTTSPLTARCSDEATQDNAVSSSTDSHTGPLRCPSANLRQSRGPLPFKISSPCLERLLQAKDSIIAPREAGGGGWPS